MKHCGPAKSNLTEFSQLSVNGTSPGVAQSKTDPKPNSGIFTIRQICRALGYARQGIYVSLRRIASSGKVPVAGKPADAWSFEVLPLDWKLRITRRGVFRDFANGEEYLATRSLVRWSPEINWDNICEKQRTKALQLQKAFAEPLSCFGEGKIKPHELQALGLKAYKSEFGYEISARHWWRLYDRIIDRDGGDEVWVDRELYLDERVGPSASAKPKVLRLEYKHKPLDDAAAALKSDGHKLTRQDRQFFWDAVFYHFEVLVEPYCVSNDPAEPAKPLRPQSPADGVEYRAVKASLISKMFKLFPNGELCKSEKCIRRCFDYTYWNWVADKTPSSTKDDRDSSGPTGHELCLSCVQLMKSLAVDNGGVYALAWQKMQRDKLLCDDCQSYWKFDEGKNKSYLPKAVKNQIDPDVQEALPHLQGPKHARLSAPYIKRNWRDTKPGDYAVLDDATPDHVTYGRVELPIPLAFEGDAENGFFVGRLEGLFQADERTDYPQAFLFILGDPPTLDAPQKKASYNAVHQRLLILRAHDQLGLPRIGYKMENGPWRNRLNDGEPQKEWQTLGHVSFANGLAEATKRTIRRALPGNPRSKIIERVFRAVWAKMQSYPTFLGAMIRNEKRELLHEFLYRVKIGKEHPGNELPPVSDFRDLVSDVMMEFAEEKQNGERLPGVSPLVAWRDGIDGHPGYKTSPLEQLGDSMRFLLSTHERVIQVGPQGIIYKISGKKFVFWGKELEDFQHKNLLCRFNFEQPELLGCRAPGEKPFIVKARVLDANTASPEELNEAQSAKASWMRHGKIIFDNLHHQNRFFFSKNNQHSDEAMEYGEFHQTATENHKIEQAATLDKTKALRKKARANGIILPTKIENPDEGSKMIDRRQYFLERMLAEDAGPEPG